MGEAADRLMAYRNSSECYAIPFAQVRELQIAAMNERLQERVDKIKLVALRARDAKLSEIRDFADAVPFLLPHTAYKSYPESFLIGGKWDKLTKWLGTVSTYPTDGVNLDGVSDVDDWISRLEESSLYVSCSSGTTGKSAMLVASRKDLDWSAQDSVAACAWASGIMPAQDRHVFSLAPVAFVPRNQAIMDELQRGFGKPGVDRFRYPVPPITVGSITQMITLRKAMSEGTALPGQIAEYETTSEAREKVLSDAIGITVDALLAVRDEKLLLIGIYNNLYKVAAAIRERGFSGKDFHPENMMYVGGGLKREQLPEDYREFVSETFNLAPQRNVQFYGMQEIGSITPRCSEARYHIPPWLVCLPLNKEADGLLPMDEGEIQCRAGFFELSLDGRWGGVISGDRIDVDFGPCPCGAATPSIRDSIVRYADLEGDDKIGCAGTVDAYVRGVL